MNAAPIAIMAQEVAKGLSMSEIEQEAEANNGEISEEIKIALATYVEAFGPVRERLMNSEGKVVQKELQRGILSDGVARGEAVEGVSLVKGSHVRLR